MHLKHDIGARASHGNLRTDREQRGCGCACRDNDIIRVQLDNCSGRLSKYINFMRFAKTEEKRFRLELACREIIFRIAIDREIGVCACGHLPDRVNRNGSARCIISKSVHGSRNRHRTKNELAVIPTHSQSTDRNQRRRIRRKNAVGR